MKIVSFTCYQVPPRWLFLKIATDEGIEGWGEPVIEGRAATVKAAVEELAAMLIGKDPLRIEDHWQMMYRGGFYRGGPILMSAIAGIDQEMYEAAEIDGANSWQKVFRITVPNLMPTMIIMLLLSLGQVFRGDFGMFYQLIGNNGVLLDTGDILDLYVYRAMSSNPNLGMSAAAGLYQSVLCFTTILLANFVVKKIQPEYTLF